MSWVTINEAHFNTNQVMAFYWSAGWLYVWFHGDKDFDQFRDPIQENYRRLCEATGMQPLEDDDCGEK